MSHTDYIARTFGPVALLTYTERVRALSERMSPGRARGLAEDELRTCANCGFQVAAKTGEARQRADGGLNHRTCPSTTAWGQAGVSRDEWQRTARPHA